ncbi:unnamed protein product [Rhizophagus irregularis]|nr:unnamed protein product [Rhizophagus irregularis]CAB5379092.1 unnamed protein product [Rhizophagus irregularis]
MLVINITFNTVTSASDEDAFAGPASVALRILYDYFISGSKTLDFKQFMRMCGKNGKDWKTFEIETACSVVLKDVGGNIDLFVIGIDELNVLYNLAKGDQRPVCDIIHAVGSLSCNTKKMLYVPILAGTIQGPLEKFIQELTYKLLRLPLRLLSNEEVNAISAYLINTHEELKNYINKNSRIVQCCISDLGGHVKALEYFYNLLLNLIKKDTHTVNYVFLMNLVKFELEEKYPFRDYAKIMEQVVARAILNIPVNKGDPVNKIRNDDKITIYSYVDLSSKGIISLEAVPDDTLFYVRMPYMWVWILTSLKESRAGKFWDVMIDQESHILWQVFEDFNVQFWILRLHLLKLLYEKIEIQVLLRGTYHAVDCPHLNYEIQLPTVDLYYIVLKSQFPDNVQIENLSPGIMYKNGKGAPCADHFFFLDDLLVFIQDKSLDATTEQPQTLSKSMIKAEHEKAVIGYKQFKDSFGSKCPIKHWILFICTNGSCTNDCFESLPENCFVVDCGNFHGYTFSSRAGFSAANDKLDANTVKEYELRTIRGIGKAIASKITLKRKERAFEDENDLYNRVKRIPPEAKTKIEVVKKYY